MSFEKRKIRTSVLIRCHEDGRIGAQENGIDQVLEDGVVFSSKETDPVQLGTGDFPGSIPLTTVLGEVTVQALLQIDQANQRITSLEAQLKSVLEEVDRLTAYATSVDAVADIPETPLA